MVSNVADFIKYDLEDSDCLCCAGVNSVTFIMENSSTLLTFKVAMSTFKYKLVVYLLNSKI